MHKYFTVDHASAAVVQPSEMKTLYLTGYNTTRFSLQHDIRREWTTFTPGDCNEPSFAPTPAPPTPVPPPTPVRVVNFGVGLAAGATAKEVYAKHGVKVLLETESAAATAGRAGEGLILPRVGGQRMLLQPPHRVLAPGDRHFNETMVAGGR
jgi:hypothetical protein